MHNSQIIPWKRLSLEAAAIVGSILLAFAIDAWWDEQKEQEAQIKQLERVSAEIKANSDRIQRKLDILTVAIDSTSEIISWMGPQPTNVQSQKYYNQWGRMYSIGTFALLRSASEDYLAAGQIETPQSTEVRRAISEWYMYGDDLEKQYDLLRVAHARLGEYLDDLVPRLHEMRLSRVMKGHPTSKFQYDHGKVLSDPSMESRLAVYLIRMEFVREEALALRDREVSLQVLIESLIQP
jgi:hypothetical protein